MIDVLLLVGIVIGAFHTGWVLREIWARHRARQLQEQLINVLFDDIHNQLKENIIPMRVEKHNEEYFLYNTTNQSFICQGKTRDELYDKFNYAHPKKKGVIFEGAEIWREVNDK